MISYIEVTPTGQIVSCGQVQNSTFHLVQPSDGNQIIQGIMITDPAQYYWTGESVETIPVRPSYTHEFDYQSKTWKVSESAVRVLRDTLLAQCDWTQLPDVPLETKTAWATYRQALRDITNQPGFPDVIEWPKPLE